MSALVSIIIPVFNAAPWLARTLESALGQTYPHTEILVVDDGSTDDSGAIARAFASRSPTVRLAEQPNRGASAARNHGLRLATGAYVQFLDADDLLAPEKVAEQVRALDHAAGGTVATARWGRFEREPAEARFTDTAVFHDFAPDAYLRTILERNLMMHPSAWLVPRPVADAAGPWDESLSLNDDGEYFARVALAASRIQFVGTAACYYRSNVSGSLSGRRDRRAVESQFRSLQLIEQRLRAHTDSPETRRALAAAWQRFIFEYHPLPRALERLAEEAVASLGGSRIEPPWGPRSLRLARLIGWRPVARLRGFARRRFLR